MTEYVSREEFLAVTRRLDLIDSLGARGVAVQMQVLTVQVQEMAKDVARHEEKHDREESARASGRRWLFAMAVAVIAAVDGPVVTIVLARGH